MALAGLAATVVPLVPAIRSATKAARSRGVKRVPAGVLRINLPFQRMAARRTAGSRARLRGSTWGDVYVNIEAPESWHPVQRSSRFPTCNSRWAVG
ncbi:hypothetical protein GCM10018775_19430 [Streptomyces umbrinus]|nr:hypothetical protein GCM10018775_19430 [Streptomyces umbrinus]